MAKKKATPTKLELPNYDEVIKSGDLLHRIILYFGDIIHQKPVTQTADGLLTDKQRIALRKTFKTSTEKKALQEALLFYKGCITYSKYLLNLRKIWQGEAAELAQLCTKWNAADNLAESWSKFLSAFYLGKMSATIKEDNGDSAPLNLYSATEIESFVRPFWDNLSTEAECRAVPLAKDNKGNTIFKIVADVDGEGGLYSKIINQRYYAEQALIIFRSALEPFSNFMLTELTLCSGDKILPYTALLPLATETMLDYPDATPYQTQKDMEKYFAFILKQRRERGETITPEDEKRAVIPDYNQVKETKHYTEVALNNLKLAFGDFYKPETDTDTDNE